MAIKKYTIAEFRKQTREAFNEVEMGGRVFISRHNTRYELVKAEIQNGKVQMAQDAIDTPKKATVTPTNFPKNGDPGAQIETADDLSDAFGPLPPKKNIADADASKGGLQPPAESVMNEPVEFAPDTPIPEVDTPRLKGMLITLRGELSRIDIDTQDPDEVERGSEMAARIGDIELELRKRGESA